MAGNLLPWVAHLTPKERNLIIGAVKTVGPAQYRTLRYNDASIADIAFWCLKDVIAFLLEAYSYQGIAAALDLALKFQGEPPPSGEE